MQKHIVTSLKSSLITAQKRRFRTLLVLAGEANRHMNVVHNTYAQYVTEFRRELNENDKTSSRQSNYAEPLRLPDWNSSDDLADKINALLGTEHQYIVFEARHNFDERYFAAATGSLTAGGLLVLQTPSFNSWLQQPRSTISTESPTTDNVQDEAKSSLICSSHSHFINRIVECINRHNTFKTMGAQLDSTNTNNDKDLFLICAVDSEPDTDNQDASTEPLNHQQPEWLQKQNNLVATLIEHWNHASHSISVVQADRGRGKSALVGRAIRQVLQRQHHTIENVTITANRKSATSVLFTYVAGKDRAARPDLPMQYSASGVEFMSVDAALRNKHSLLIVEEAGSLPIPVLIKMLSLSKHVVFVTTVQGYEGAGRGFAIRFASELDKLNKTEKQSWLKLEPDYPIRWALGDPVEAFTNDALLLNTSIAGIQNPQQLAPEHSTVRLVTKIELASNSTLLENVFGLLVQAHYQTTPSDLRHMLDTDNMLLFLQYVGGQLVGAALIAIEGRIPGNLHSAIMDRRRRLPDQLLPQMLSLVSNDPSALMASYARVVRIAVHPELQRQGFGSWLFKQVYSELGERYPIIGASFGADSKTTSFWLKLGLIAIHYGHKANPRSGLRSVCMVNSNDKTIQKIILNAHAILAKNLAALASSNRDDATLMKSIGAQMQIGVTINASDRLALLKKFSDGRRSFIDSVGYITDFAHTTEHEDIKLILNTLIHGPVLEPRVQRSNEKSLRDLVKAELLLNPTGDTL